MSDLTNPTYLKQLCDKYKLIPSKKYGQNFLISLKPVETMVKIAELTDQDIVYEIGPGFGILTNELIKQAGTVKAFEIEKKLQSFWQEQPTDDLEIIWGNILHTNLDQTKKYKLVANLPYQITSAVLRKFLEAVNKPQSITVMVQLEVAQRICAQPGKMSVLAIAVQYYGQPQLVTKVPKSSFWPQPKVDSAVLHIQNIAQPQHNFTAQQFFRFVKIGFSSKRKMLIKNLLSVQTKDKPAYQKKLEEIFTKLEIKPKARAQELSLEQWIKLVGSLAIN